MTLKRIILHWTAGSYTVNDIERKAYHYMVDGNGKVHKGVFRPEDNIPPLRTGHYAAHCGGGNSNAIGLALCGMSGFVSVSNSGRFPLKRVQFERVCNLSAALCRTYGIDPRNPKQVRTHYEFGLAHPTSSSRGKIDIIHLPFQPNLEPGDIGGYYREKTYWYYLKQ